MRCRDSRNQLILSDDAKKAVLFVGNSRGEINAAAQRKKIPEAVNLKRRAIGAHERLDEIAGDGIVIVDEPVTEITDPEVAAFHESKSPWGIEVSV